MPGAIFRTKYYIISSVLSAAVHSYLNQTTQTLVESFRAIIGVHRGPPKLRCQRHSNLLLCSPCRSDRTTLPPTGSAFTREDADPLTPAREPQCNVGTETQRIMGKEVKEEQNRLKGCVVSSFGISFYCWRNHTVALDWERTTPSVLAKDELSLFQPHDFCGYRK